MNANQLKMNIALRRCNMNHYVSVNITQGNDGDAEMMKMTLKQALRESILKAPEDKHDCWLMSHGYSAFSNEYHRCEDNFNRLDTILLDFDNEQDITHDDGTTEKVVFDKDLMKKFEEEYKQYDYIIWESASSTKEWPKFRVIFLLDKPIEFVIEDGVKYTKKAIISIFSKFKPDQKASWYFTPTKSKVATVRRNKGIPFPSERLSWMTTSMMKTRQLYNTLNEHKLKELRTEHERNPDGWRNLPSVKRCLDGLVQGERDNSINQACYAMKKLGYGDKIIEFIEEVELTSNLPKDMVRKFKNKYRG